VDTPTRDETVAVGAADPLLPLDLGDGLVLRAATPADAEVLAVFNAEVHREPGATEPDQGIAGWTRDLLERPHPTFRPDLFTLVEERATGAVVSCLNLIPQTWSYGGVPFGVGRIELVGTHPDHRRRGLVRRQMEVVHRWSAELGHLVQGITGIPWYYRQFGYEMTLVLGGSRQVPAWRVPSLPDGETEPYRVRPATPADLPFIAEVDTHGRARYLVSCVRDDAMWRYELDGRGDENGGRLVLAVVETAAGGDEAGRPVGFLAHTARLWGPGLAVAAYELAPGTSWLAATPTVLRYLRHTGERYAATGARLGTSGGSDRLEVIGFRFGTDHPVYRALPDRALPGSPPYAWYIRVPDLPAFLRHVAPVLEARLAASAAVGHTGELRLDFYRDGLRLAFEGGRLTAVEPWSADGQPGADAAFPPLTFLHLLVGHRSLAELEHLFADCHANTEEARVLLDALFPPHPSLVWPVS